MLNHLYVVHIACPPDAILGKDDLHDLLQVSLVLFLVHFFIRELLPLIPSLHELLLFLNHSHETVRELSNLSLGLERGAWSGFLGFFEVNLDFHHVLDDLVLNVVLVKELVYGEAFNLVWLLRKLSGLNLGNLVEFEVFVPGL